VDNFRKLYFLISEALKNGEGVWYEVLDEDF
jgi:hypothetical protein